MSLLTYYSDLDLQALKLKLLLWTVSSHGQRIRLICVTRHAKRDLSELLYRNNKKRNEASTCKGSHQNRILSNKFGAILPEYGLIRMDSVDSELIRL